MNGPAQRPIETMSLASGELCLDLVNTGSGRDGPDSDRLQDYADLVRWAERTGSVTPGEGEVLRARAAASPAAAQAVLERVRGLREAMFRVFRARMEGAQAAATDLGVLAEAAAEASAKHRLMQRDGEFELGWTEAESLDRPWWPAAVAAVALLTSADVSRVKECASHTCDWLFLDLSKNRSRRWCDMKDCGNRAKARRYYGRKKSDLP